MMLNNNRTKQIFIIVGMIVLVGFLFTREIKGLVKPKEEDEKMLKADKWNSMRIQAKGDEITSWLNGKQMVHIKDQKIGEGDGFIALQIHDGGGIKVRWRNIQIKELN